MIISGFDKLTLNNYPDKVACMIFTSGCNFKCPYCHNSPLIKQNKQTLIEEKVIFDYLEKRKNVLDGIVISGGEPTVQKDLIEFIKKIKKTKLKIKLDTNGYKPEVLKEVIKNNLIDYIAMDIKHSIDEYKSICGIKIDKNKILESIELIKNSGIDHEFRTTIIKDKHNIETLKTIINQLDGSKYYIQNFENSDQVLDKTLKSFNEKEVQKIQKELERYSNVKVK